MKKILFLALIAILSTNLSIGQNFFNPVNLAKINEEKERKFKLKEADRKAKLGAAFTAGSNTSIAFTSGDKSWSIFKNNTIKGSDLWNGQDKITNFSGNFKDYFSSVYVEWYADNFGPLRVAFATSLVNAQNDTIKEFQTFINSGGNAIIKSTLPILLWYSNSKPENNNIGIFLDSRLGFSIPKVGTSSDIGAVNFDIGAEIHFRITGEQNKLGFVGKGRAALLSTNNEFRMKNNIEEKIYPYVLGSIGIVLDNKFYIMLNSPLSGTIGSNAGASNKANISVSMNF